MSKVYPLIAILFILLAAGCVEEEPPELEVARFATYHDFIISEEGLPALQESYGFEFDVVYDLVFGLTHEALYHGDVDAAMGYATDGKIQELDLVRLTDDKSFFSVYNPAPVIRRETLQEHPQIEEIMAAISAQLDTDTMINLNYLADIKEYPHSEIARDWLKQEGFLSGEGQPALDTEPVIIGAKPFTEQQTLAQITILALEHAGIPVEDRTDLGDTPQNRNALLTGEIHLYWEYTGTAWWEIFEKEDPLPDHELYQRIAKKDAENDLVWLEPAPLKDSYAILMQEERARELEITTISDLALWVNQLQE
ncbi:ABC transporter substrate-binding protein [Dethiobacter alkaliphilus]|uniref:Substrate-binding region of ABC-type glycine betaine transport system n=1 Tax=Dethiobacter alkaliphilus AHT 1 TaxID=555088 RepID=C0GGL0_DETAL|nr:glycine betaine ABC transporter substrate-binding protein [Dethiobacter alkaliphilus]EEG77451.1 Substrate-binding region of ABC-type glycine betaine transport system [Dethiobacter alkaliphilus AHT 1]